MLVAYNITLTNATLTAPESEEPGEIPKSSSEEPGAAWQQRSAALNFFRGGGQEFFSASCWRAVSAQKKTPSEEGASWLGLVILVYPFYDFFHGVRATGYR